MSSKALAIVFDCGLGPNDKLVALIYANGVDDEGNGFGHSYSWIAAKTGLKRRSVIRIVQRLEQAGMLSGTGHTSIGTRVCRLHFDAFPPPIPVDDVLKSERRKPFAKKAVVTLGHHADLSQIAPFCKPGGAPESPPVVTQSHLSEESESYNMLDTDRQNLLQIPEAQKEEEDLLSPDSRAFWDMFGKRHQTIFGTPYNGPAVEMDTHPTLRTLQALDAAERFEIVNQGLKAMADSGQLGTVGSWDLYETEIQRAINDYAAQRKANQVIGMFTANLNEALVRCHLPVMTGTYTAKQRQEIASWGQQLDADDLEAAITKYMGIHCKNGEPFILSVRLSWVIKTAWTDKQATASGAVPAARNGNGNGNYSAGYRNSAAGNRAGGSRQANSQSTLAEWEEYAVQLNGIRSSV